MRLSLSLAAASMVLASPALAQSFHVGDVYIISADLPSPNGSHPGVSRIEPGTWTVTPIHTGNECQFGRGAYDPFRDKIVLFGGSQAGFQLLSADGTVTPLPFSGGSSLPAPAGDGRIYYYDGTNFRVIDAANTSHLLVNETGTGNVTDPGGSVSALWFDAATGSLIVARYGFGGGAVALDRFTMSASGLQVTARASITYSDPTGALGVSEMSEGPSGTVFVKIANNGGAQPDGASARMKLLDASTMMLTTFAVTAYFAAWTENCGVYDPSISAAGLALDSFEDNIHLFTLGQSGAGTTVVTNGVSSPGGSAELAQLIAITAPPSRCGSADFNGDGDVGTDSDIEAFFACLAGTCCSTCGSADFNGDGDLGTDADIDSFFRVLAGGPC